MDDLQRSLLNIFTASDLDRMVPQRKHHAWIDRLLTDESTKFIVFREDEFLLSNSTPTAPSFLTHQEVENAVTCQKLNVFLGMQDSRAYFASQLLVPTDVNQAFLKYGEFANLRKYAFKLNRGYASLLSYAKALFHWHQAHAFCSICGSETREDQAGHIRVCSNVSCNVNHFPRTDPAIIASVIHEGRCLFGRQPTWPTNRYSVIAGFVEPGESLEQAVLREVSEETDIRITKVKYHSSQPWPFPGSLMLGFSATAENSEIRLNDGELEDAHWRDVDEVVLGLEQGTFLLPPRLSIAYRLIEDWFNEYSDTQLKTVYERMGK